MTTRNTLDREIRLVQDETLLLGNLVEQAVLNSVETLKSRTPPRQRLSSATTRQSMINASR